MLAYVLKRLIQTAVVVLIVATLMFWLTRQTGDPVQMLLPADASTAEVAEMRQHLGLDQPLIVQYGRFLLSAAQGNLGVSYHYREPAMKLILERLPASLELVVSTTVISLLLGVPLGVLCAVHKGKLVDRLILGASLIGISAPPFWVSLVMILLFSLTLKWLPSSGRDGILSLLLPAGSLALYRIAFGVRIIRTGMLEILSQNYIRTARAKGLAERVVTYKHALRNTLVPFVTIVGLQMGAILSGAVVTESIFAWPGMGRLMIMAVERLDFPVIIAYAMTVAVIFAFLNLAVDLTYAALDPRVRYH